MGFSFKKALKKVEKTVKKVAPAALTVVNPALGASYAAVQAGLKAAKARAQTQGGTSEDFALIAGAGATGYTSPTGIGMFQSPQPQVGDSVNFQKWANGGGRASFMDLVKGPLPLMLVFVLVMGLIFFISSRKR